MRKKYFLLLFCASFIFCLIGGKAQASEMDFSVQAVIPSNQVDKSKTYFDLRMAPGQSQDLMVELRNATSSAVTVNVSPNTAITNQNGVVDYSMSKARRDSSLKVCFEDIASTNNEVTVPAKGTKKIAVHVKMPDRPFDGVLLGGLYFTEKTAESKDSGNKGTQILNRYAYVIGVKLTESDKVVPPELRLRSVKASQVNYRNVIVANIQNYKAAILTNLKIEGNVYRKGEKHPVYSETRENLRMAPNSNFDYAIGMHNQAFKPGEYTFKGVAHSGKREW
ncbi:DUF916 and DUF3324 domain-containing protein, partial [Lactococcus garvieae]|uniref:DUF916 and DUF3324 domain-containing protein n=1 Tax=Lactococcus garvieae TaxID=1363 RepID=UPI00254C4535